MGRLTDEQRAKGRANAAKNLGPAGCSRRASIAANARWGRRKGKPAVKVIRPSATCIFAWAEMLLDEHGGSPGYGRQRVALAELIAWYRAVARNGE